MFHHLSPRDVGEKGTEHGGHAHMVTARSTLRVMPLTRLRLLPAAPPRIQAARPVRGETRPATQGVST
jgi:hypothetical protein